MLRHDSGKTNEIIVQISLGCYLTPIGALAGIMWFHMVRRDGTRYGMLVPRPVNLFWHGGLHFVICTVALCATLPGSHILWALITTGEKPAKVSVQVGFVAGLVLVVGLVRWSSRSGSSSAGRTTFPTPITKSWVCQISPTDYT